MAIDSFKVKKSLNIDPSAVAGTSPSAGDLRVDSADSNKPKFHNGTVEDEIPTASSTSTFTNKTINSDSNTLSNIKNADIKALAAIDATKIANGSVSNTEFQYLDGVSSAIQTQFGNKQDTITGAASTLVSSNLTTNRALIANSSGKVAVSTVTDTELGYVSGVTSALQTQLNAKQATITGAASSIVTSNLSNSIALVSDGSGKVASSAVTATELGYLSGVTSALQTQINSISSSSNPSGTVIMFAGQAAPTGYLACDGSTVSRTTYATLFAAIGTAHGIGDGSTTFHLPDLRGKFVRGYDGAAGNDPDKSSRVAPQSGTFTVSGGATTNGSSTITVSSTTEIAPGMAVSGTGIPASAVVRAILSSTTFTLGDLGNSANVNATATNTGLTFTLAKSAAGNYVGSTQTYSNASHGHALYGGNGAGGAQQLGAPSVGVLGTSTPSGPAYYTTGSTSQAFVQTQGGNEARPLNVTLIYCVKT